MAMNDRPLGCPTRQKVAQGNGVQANPVGLLLAWPSCQYSRASCDLRLLGGCRDYPENGQPPPFALCLRARFRLPHTPHIPAARKRARRCALVSFLSFTGKFRHVADSAGERREKATPLKYHLCQEIKGPHGKNCLGERMANMLVCAGTGMTPFSLNLRQASHCCATLVS